MKPGEYFIEFIMATKKKHNLKQSCVTKCLLSCRELLESEQSQRLQQASLEEQLNTVRQSLQDQSSAARSLTSGLGAQLENMQKQVSQVTYDQTEP